MSAFRRELDGGQLEPSPGRCLRPWVVIPNRKALLLNGFLTPALL